MPKSAVFTARALVRGRVLLGQQGRFSVAATLIGLFAAIAAAAEPSCPIGVYAAEPLTPITTNWMPAAADARAPVQLFGPRGGFASGQAVAVAEAAVQVAVSDLTGPGGTIPAAAISVRYATRQMDLTSHNPHPALMPYFDTLAATPLAGQRIQPVWVTVEIPPGAPAGNYTGAMRFSGGVRGVVPMQVQVTGFTMPALAQRRNWLGLVQGLDSVADRYGAALYSERHFALLEKSFALLGKLGQNVLLVPVIEQNFGGVTRGLITFTQQGAQLKPDFSAFDRYLALHIRQCGVPRVAILELWQVYMAARDGERQPRDPTQAVLTLKQGAGLTSLEVPLYPAQARFWTELYRALHERLRQAGVPAAAICLGFYSDRRPSADQVNFWKQVDPESKWAGYTHGYAGFEPPGAAVGYCEIPDAHPGINGQHRRGGWDSTRPFVTSARGYHEDTMLPAAWRNLPEVALARCQVGPSKGLGRVGFDAWRLPVPQQPGKWYSRMDPQDSLYSKHGRLIRGNTRSFVAPGPDGAIPTVRYLMFREGLQDLEARIAIEAAAAAKLIPSAEADAVLLDWWAYLAPATKEDKRPYTERIAYTERWRERTLAVHALAAKATATLQRE